MELNMNVALPTELEKRVNESIERGEFTTRDEFFKQAVELLLEVCHNGGEPIAVDENWGARIESLLEEAEAGGEAREMTDRDWDEVERQGMALIQARKKAWPSDGSSPDKPGRTARPDSALCLPRRGQQP
jgi:Arc/MetJ-type ribon-helix-helix transcriptional regulator